ASISRYQVLIYVSHHHNEHPLFFKQVPRRKEGSLRRNMRNLYSLVFLRLRLVKRLSKPYVKKRKMRGEIQTRLKFFHYLHRLLDVQKKKRTQNLKSIKNIRVMKVDWLSLGVGRVWIYLDTIQTTRSNISKMMRFIQPLRHLQK